ncbi:MAG TPA: hypothetical protein VFB33_06190 [Candidatus Binataceae bacterium]|jgi:uncharacterized membrane protein|nr:hypothetical protein [Candidatus Binataceae bacterium]
MASGRQLALCLGLGLFASTLLALGLLMMKSRAEALPIARGRNATRAVLVWLRDPVWTGGLVIQTAGYALYVLALAGAPVSLMAVAMQGGIALFVLLAVLFLGERAQFREWLGIGAFLVAASMLAVSLGAGAAEGALHPDALATASVIAVALAIAPIGATRLRESGTGFAIASGLAFGMGSLYTKALADTLAGVQGAAAVAHALALSPWTWLIVTANVAGLIVLQNAFALGRGIIAMPISSAFSNLIPIVGGIAAFGERLPSDSLGAAMRVGAFALTLIAGVALAAGDLDAKAR